MAYMCASIVKGMKFSVIATDYQHAHGQFAAFQSQCSARLFQLNCPFQVDRDLAVAADGNRVGAILYDNRVERVIPASGGRLHVLRLINDLQRQPRLAAAPLTDLNVLLETGFRMIRRRSLVFVISDFISAPGWEKPLSLLNRKHEVLAVRLWDSSENELPDIGLVLMQDAETGEQAWVDTHESRFRRRFTEIVQRRQANLDAAFRSAGVDVLALSTEDDLVRAIVQFAAQRKQHKQIAGS